MSADHNDNTPDLGSVYLSKDTATKLSMGSFALGALGLAGALFGVFSEGTRAQALHSYLVAFFFVATLALGGLFFVVLQHLVGAMWSTVVRRLAEIMAATLPVLALLFIPIALSVSKLYPWAGLAAREHAVVAKAAYLNLPFFLGRAALYLVIWGAMGMLVLRRSLALDKSGDPFILLRMRKLAPIGMLVFGTTLTFAGFDWLMSLDAQWYSTIFGVYLFAGTVTSSFSMLAITAILLGRAGLLQDVITTEHYHDLGKLIFGFIVFWTYIAFSQYFLYWYSNIPEETLWFQHRWEGSWATLSVGLILLHFAVPFFGLLSRNAKRSKAALAVFGGLLIVMHYLDLYWIVMPQAHPEGVSPHWLDVAALLGTVGVFLGLVIRRMGTVPLIPIKDPLLQASMEFENA